MTLLLNSFRRFNASVIFALWGIFILKSSSSKPWTPYASFVHNRAHWRLLIPRKSQQTEKPHVCSNGACVDSSTTSLSSNNNDFNIIDKIGQALGIDQLFNQKYPLSSVSKSTDPKRIRGQVIRTAARPHQTSGGSTPSSRHYTTRKPSLPMIVVSDQGVTGDYNHYRTAALKSTENRAISILTRDVSSYIQTLDGGYFANRGYRDGDLGENVLVEGVDFGFFQVGERYRFTSQKEGTMEDVIVEITEAMEPCANLCKLPYINDPSISSPKERVGRCQYFIAALGKKEGLRGWYAKVVKGGVIRIGDMAAFA
mmetsp:Transcript_41024/g.72139  ORF Transcript_41024/g.72139 Transcript_41024/m.72139 type:complete len:312 (-) Transcript_41024:210-1145(-)